MSSIVFGYLVGFSGSYTTPFVPMVLLLCVGASLWVQVDPEQELFAEPFPAECVAVATS